MALTAAQIIDTAKQISKAQGFDAQALNLLNMALSDLCDTYDLGVIRKTHYFNFDPGVRTLIGDNVYGSGPYFMPADFLRPIFGEMWWTLLGVKYPLIPCDLYEFDLLVQQAGNQSYPALMAFDVSPSDAVQQGGTTTQGYVWPPPSGTYPVTIRYQARAADITDTAQVPWFPNQAYLIARLAGELMRITDDARSDTFLGDGPSGAQGILDRYLKLKDADSNRAQTVKLDPRRFGRSNFARLPNTKTVGW